MRPESDPLPEVGELVEGVAAMDEVSRPTVFGVCVGEKPGLDDRHVG